MNKKYYLNLVLACAVIIITLILFNIDEQPVSESITVSTQLQADIQTIVVEREEKETLSFRRTDNGWNMEKPYQARAHKNRIAAMLNITRTSSFTQLNSSDVRLERFDLVQPVITMMLNKEAFYFGGTNPLQDRRYIRVSDTIHLVDDHLFPQLQQDATFFISNRLLPDVGSILLIQFPGHRILMTDNRWQILPATGWSEQRVIEMIKNWQDARALQVSKARRARPIGTITVETSMGIAIHFDIVQPPPELVLARKDLGIEYVIPQTPDSTLMIDY